MISSALTLGLIWALATSPVSAASRPRELPIAGFDAVDFRPDVFQLVRDGSVVVVDALAAYHWDAQGKLRSKLVVLEEGKPLRVRMAYYIWSRKLYWVATEIGTFFLDQRGKVLARAYMIGPEGQMLDIAPRIMLEDGDRLFAVAMDYIDLWKNPNPQVISEVAFGVPDRGQVIVTKVGSSFSTLTDLQRSFNFNFKLHWLIGGRFHNDLYVIDQITPMIRHFVQDPEIKNNKLELEGKRIMLSLPGFKPAPLGWSRAIKTKEDHLRWWSSWSRITGCYANREGYLVLYEVPDPKRATESIQLMQQVNREGRVVGEVSQVQGAPLGIFRGELVLVAPTTKGVRVSYLPV